MVAVLLCCDKNWSVSHVPLQVQNGQICNNMSTH